tara:strand:- start:6124 stop:6576 length:453 start_codon:yes stop_codon:yes gene_type:complete
MWKPNSKEINGKRFCGLCGFLGHHHFGLYDNYRKKNIGWVCKKKQQDYVNNILGGDMKIKEADKVQTWNCVEETVKNQLFNFLKDEGLFNKSFKEIEKSDAIRLVYCVLEGYRDNLNKRIKVDAIREAEDQLADEFWGPDDPIPWMEKED